MQPREPLLRAEPRVVFTEMNDGTGLLLHLGTKLYFTLNRTGVHVWKALESAPRSRAQLVDGLVARFECTPEQVEADLSPLLDEMIGERLVRLD